MAQQKPTLEVLAAQESDIDNLVDVEFSSFEHDPFHVPLNPGDRSSSTVRKAAGERTLKQWRNDPTCRIMKCVDRDNGHILGYATWNFYLEGRSSEERSEPFVADWLEGRNKEIAECFFNTLAAMKEKVWGGKRFIGRGWPGGCLCCVDMRMLTWGDRIELPRRPPRSSAERRRQGAGSMGYRAV